MDKPPVPPTGDIMQSTFGRHADVRRDEGGFWLSLGNDVDEAASSDE
ncbi:MAG: hypothetical protein RIC55_19010 [Pirellulaceae bacterium]